MRVTRNDPDLCAKPNKSRVSRVNRNTTSVERSLGERRLIDENFITSKANTLRKLYKFIFTKCLYN